LFPSLAERASWHAQKKVQEREESREKKSQENQSICEKNTNFKLEEKSKHSSSKKRGKQSCLNFN